MPVVEAIGLAETGCALSESATKLSSLLISAINAPAEIRLLLINVNNFYSTFQEVEKTLSLRPQDKRRSGRPSASRCNRQQTRAVREKLQLRLT